MQIDEEILILGSSNFDHNSYRYYSEIVLISYLKDLNNDFNQQIWEKDLSLCGPEIDKPYLYDYFHFYLTRSVMCLLNLLTFLNR